MSWLDSAFRFRAAITVDTSAAGGTPDDVSFTIPDQWDHFWKEIDSSGFELRVTLANGHTAQTYQVLSFNKTTRVATLEFQSFPHVNVADSMSLAWLYYGSTGQGTGAGSFTAMSPFSAVIDRSIPRQLRGAMGPGVPGLTRPRDIIQKTTDEEVKVWFQVRGLARAARNIAGRLFYEEPWYLLPTILNSAGSPVSSMFDASKSGFTNHRGQIFAFVHVQAGATATPYTVAPQIGTLLPNGGATAHQILNPRRGLRVEDILLT